MSMNLRNVTLGFLIMAPWKGPPLSMQWEISAISGAIGLSLAGYEIWRRRNRTVLVKDGEQIAVYRKGRLDLILAPSEITQVESRSADYPPGRGRPGSFRSTFHGNRHHGILQKYAREHCRFPAHYVAGPHLRGFPGLRRMDTVCLRSLTSAYQGQVVYGKGDSAASYFPDAGIILAFYLSKR